jgi:hypothetical protein
VSGRYAQLTYTSFDSAGSAGGWRVKHRSPDLSDPEAELLTAGVRTVLRPVDALPAYPSPEQVDAAPRRLAYRRDAAGAGAYWHAVPAGPDSTGRPGNVFTHALLDRAPDTGPPLRPIQRWRAPGWLRPYGAAAVTAATLTDTAPGAGSAITTTGVIDFALDTGVWRLGTLLGLLDAVAAALDGGPPVILAAATPDTAAHWIGLVSFLMSAGAAASLSFSTFDRADELGSATQAGQHLTAVPLADLAALSAGDATVIDETAMLSLGELGGAPHRTATGQPITVTAFSVLAQEALLDPATARAVLHDIDRRAERAGPAALSPAWPLASVIAADAAFADAHHEAHDVLAAVAAPAREQAPQRHASTAPTLRSN